jgi:hypothetical protein
MQETTATVLSGHVSPETAYVIQDYPYGRTLRCKKRVWIETATKGAKKHQCRMVYQTTNPKQHGEPWNKQKNGGYYDYLMLFIDPETGYLECAGIYDASSRAIEAFKEKWYHLMPEAEKENFDKKYSHSFIEALKKIEEKIRESYSKSTLVIN